jgi:hydroxyacylglutathione hydrolase
MTIKLPMKAFDLKNEARLELRQCIVGPWSVNAYGVVCPLSGKSLLVDPGAEPEQLKRMLADSEPVAAVITHGHPDHTGALQAMRRAMKLPVMAFAEGGVQADRTLAEGDCISVGHFKLRVYHTPGHAADAICLAFESDCRILVGDVIFEGGPGKTWSAAEFQTTRGTLRRILAQWPDDSVCYPGHGPAFRLSDQRFLIEAFLKKDHGAFYGDATWGM